MNIPGVDIIEKMGESESASVWKGRQVTLDRPVAVKVLSPQLAADARNRQSFLQEARLAALLNHPAVVQVYDVGEALGSCFIIMEYVQGMTLGQVMQTGGRIEEKRALTIARRIAEALDYAWNRARLAHLAIKPDNILIAPDGSFKIADLGIARAADKLIVHTSETVGVPNYMSPEQVTGKHKPDFRSDIYSLGATLYHMVTGVVPFEGKPAEEVPALHEKGHLPSPSSKRFEVAPGISQLLVHMMMKDPERRHGSWGEVIRDIDRLLEGKKYLYTKPPEGVSTVLAAGPASAAPAARPAGGEAAPRGERAPAPDRPLARTAEEEPGLLARLPYAVSIVFLVWLAVTLWRMPPPVPPVRQERVPLPVTSAPLPAAAGTAAQPPDGTVRAARRPAWPAPSASPEAPPTAPAAPELAPEPAPAAPAAPPAPPPPKPDPYVAATDEAVVRLAEGAPDKALQALDRALADPEAREAAARLQPVRQFIAAIPSSDTLLEDAVKQKTGRRFTLSLGGGPREVEITGLEGQSLVVGELVRTELGVVRKHYSVPLDQVGPLDRCTLISDGPGAERAAMKFILAAKGGALDKAAEYAARSGIMAESFSRYLKTRQP